MTDINAMQFSTSSMYDAVRHGAGVWLRHSVSQIRVAGSDRFTWLQGMISNDTRLLQSNSARRLPACILDSTGHLLADIVLTALAEEPDALMLECPASEREKIFKLLDRYLITEDVDLSKSNLVAVTIQGPQSGLIAAKLSIQFNCGYYVTDHTGSGGFDAYFEPDTAAEYLAQAVQLGAEKISDEMIIELLRIEAGIPLYGTDMDVTTIALEAGLGPTHISMTKGCYVGQEIIARIDSRGHTNKQLTGMVFPAGAVISEGDLVYPEGQEEGGTRECGRVTSVALNSPVYGGRPIALGYVRHENRKPKSAIRVNACVGEVVELPYFNGLTTLQID